MNLMLSSLYLSYIEGNLCVDEKRKRINLSNTFIKIHNSRIQVIEGVESPEHYKDRSNHL